jgi:hypothetical protein
MPSAMKRAGPSLGLVRIAPEVESLEEQQFAGADVFQPDLFAHVWRAYIVDRLFD